jgi:hypothetical protein
MQSAANDFEIADRIGALRKFGVAAIFRTMRPSTLGTHARDRSAANIAPKRFSERKQ